MKTRFRMRCWKPEKAVCFLAAQARFRKIADSKIRRCTTIHRRIQLRKTHTRMQFFSSGFQDSAETGSLYDTGCLWNALWFWKQPALFFCVMRHGDTVIIPRIHRNCIIVHIASTCLCFCQVECRFTICPAAGSAAASLYPDIPDTDFRQHLVSDRRWWNIEHIVAFPTVKRIADDQICIHDLLCVCTAGAGSVTYLHRELCCWNGKRCSQAKCCCKTYSRKLFVFHINQFPFLYITMSQQSALFLCIRKFVWINKKHIRKLCILMCFCL